MKLSSKGRYAVMALTDLFLKSKNQEFISLTEIAQTQSLSIDYLEQIFSKLKKHQLVKSARGHNGGYALAKDAHEIKIVEIIQAVDEKIKVTRCQSNSKMGCMPDNSQCLTHHLWEALEQQIHIFLSSITLKDVSSGNFKEQFFFKKTNFNIGPNPVTV